MDYKKFKQKVAQIHKNTASVVVALQAAQEAFHYITPKAVEIIADIFDQSRCTVYGTATFYHQFSFAPKGKNVISVCMGTACFVCGAADIMKTVEDELGIPAGSVTKDGQFSIEHNTRCVGNCAMAPIVVINDRQIEKATAKTVLAEIRKIKSAANGGANG